MRIDIITVVPELLKSPFESSILKNSIDKGIVNIKIHNLREYSNNKYKSVDDYQFGGGAGMVLMIEPIDKCISKLKNERQYDEVIYLSPDGEKLNQSIANKFSDLKGYLNSKRPNDVVKIKLKVNSKEKLVSVKLNKNERVQFYLIGVLKNMSKEELIKSDLSSGVKISEFNNNYKKYWEDYGIRVGNIVKSINGNKIHTILDVERILKSRKYHDPINIEIINDNNLTERFNFR